MYCLFEKTENKRKETGIGPFKKQSENDALNFNESKRIKPSCKKCGRNRKYRRNGTAQILKA